MSNPNRSNDRPLTFADWQQLPPAEAAREFHLRATSRLSPAQQRAVFVELPSEEKIAARFTTARSTPGILSGVPYALKDLYDVAGSPMFAGSTFLPEVRPVPARDGAIVHALRDAGAVLAARTHLHEFAYGITGENPHYGDCEHPRFPGRTTGGSSSGSAAAVAAGIVPLAIGSDTGGSVRVPAAFCGLFGFRMTPHHPWIADAFPLVPSFDTAGWFTATAADMRAAITGLIGLAPESGAARGVYLEMPGLDADVALACRETAARFAPPADEATQDELHRHFQTALDCYSVIVAREAWQVHEKWTARYHDRYDPAVWERLNRGHALTPEKVSEAEAVLTAVRRTLDDFFRRFDFLILPATPFGAPTKAEITPTSRPRLLTLTAPASLGGQPVLVVPVALPSGLTTGLQIIVKDVRSPVIAWALRLAS